MKPPGEIEADDAESDSEKDTKTQADEAEGEEIKSKPVTVWTEILQSIPMTAEYKQYQKDNKKIIDDDNINRIEKQLERCRNVDKLFAEGRYDLGLRKLKKEIKFSDFEAYQQMRVEMEAVGEWRYTPRKEDQGKIRGILDILEDMLADEKEEEEQERPHSIVAEKVSFLNDSGLNNKCTWSMKGLDGKLHHCTNGKAKHVHMIKKDMYGRSCSVYWHHCLWHLKACHNDHEMRFVKVVFPNERGLCNECFVRATGKTPFKLDPLKIPGVVKKTSPKEGSSLNALKTSLCAVVRQKTCQWTPGPQGSEQPRFRCTNKALTDSEKKNCGYHQPFCTMKHADEAKMNITRPNPEGLCVSHFCTKYHRSPPVLPWPCPGMVEQKFRGHPLGPCVSPRDYVLLNEGNSYVTSSDVGRKLLKTINVKILLQQGHMSDPVRSIAHNNAITGAYNGYPACTVENKMAIRIQKAFRGFQSFHYKRKIANIKLAKRRLLSVLRIAAWVRGNLVRRRFAKRLATARNAATKIAATWRGRKQRDTLKRQKAARIIIKAVYRNHGRLVRIAHRYVLHERWALSRWDCSILVAQRIIRGYIGRRVYLKTKREAAIYLLSILSIQKYTRKFLKRLEEARQREHEERHIRCLRVVTSFIQFYVWRTRWRKHFHKLQVASTKIQSAGRLYLARSRANKEKLLLKDVWNWYNPKVLDLAVLETFLPRTTYGIPEPLEEISYAEDSFFLSPNVLNNSDNSEIASLMLAVESKTFSTSDKSVQTPLQHEDLFRVVDPKPFGTCSTSEFVMVLTNIWQRSGYTLQTDEVAALVRRFDINNDGLIPYKLFLMYALKHETPCYQHGRLICGECFFCGECLLRDGGIRCTCVRFKNKNASVTRHMCACGHMDQNHVVLPSLERPERPPIEALRIPFISQRQLSNILTRERVVVPYTLSINDAIHISGHPDCVKKLSDKRSRPFNRIEKKSKKSLDDTTDPHVNHQGDLSSIACKESYSKESLYVTRQSQRKNDGARENARPSPYTISIEMMKFERELIDAKGGLPLKQSQAGLLYGFQITSPILLVANDELRNCIRPVQLYLHLIKILSDDRLDLLKDKNEYTNMIAHHAIYLERHWKKLIKDIRRGTLSELLPIPSHSRLRLESLMAPNPKRAQMLEQAFQDLGFHRRASGIPRVERPSQLIDKCLEGRRMFRNHDVFPEYKSPYRIKSLTRNQRKGRRRPNTTPTIDKETNKDELLGGRSVDVSDKQSQKSSSRRRGSCCDIDKELTNPDIFSIGYKLSTMPISGQDPILQETNRNRKRFVCGFPSCGRAYSNHELVEAHQKDHILRMRVGQSNPSVDQHMSAFWPTESSLWTSSASVQSTAFPYVCPFKTCGKDFAEPQALKQHIRASHTIFELKKICFSGTSTGYLGHPRIVPPFDPPIRCKLAFCPIPSHSPKRPCFRCPFCRDVLASELQVPVQFYTKGKIATERGTVSFEITKCEKTLCIQPKGDPSDRFNKVALNAVHLVGVCEDRFKRCFLCIAPYLEYETLREMGFEKFPPNFDRDNELVQQLETKFVDISSIRGFSYTLCCTREQFYQKKVQGTLPQGAPVKFCRYVYSSANNVLVGERTRIKDPYIDSGVLYFSNKAVASQSTKA